jgi:hypothetical protein
MTKAPLGAATLCAGLDNPADLVLHFTIYKRFFEKCVIALSDENLDVCRALLVVCRNARGYPRFADQIRPVSSTLGGVCGSY